MIFLKREEKKINVFFKNINIIIQLCIALQIIS